MDKAIIAAKLFDIINVNKAKEDEVERLDAKEVKQALQNLGLSIFDIKEGATKAEFVNSYMKSETVKPEEDAIIAENIEKMKAKKEELIPSKNVRDDIKRNKEMIAILDKEAKILKEKANQLFEEYARMYEQESKEDQEQKFGL